MRTVRSFAAFTVALVITGCASPPEIVDMTPRFTAGASRVESLQAYAAVRTALKDVAAHVGFSWRAKVVDVGPEGATVQANMTRIVCKLPGLITFDSDGLIPLGSLLGVTEMLFKLVGATFEYSIGPTGEVRVSGWNSALSKAARETRQQVPLDGSVPTEDMVAEALRRMYGAPMPRRPVKLEESWGATAEFHLGNPETGPRVRSNDRYTYAGFGELRVPFGGDEELVEGLGVPVESSANVAMKGSTFLGEIDVQTGRSGGYLVMGLRGDQVLGYWEKNELKILPKEGLLPAPAQTLLGGVVQLGTKLANLECGWAFFAGEWR